MFDKIFSSTNLTVSTLISFPSTDLIPKLEGCDTYWMMTPKKWRLHENYLKLIT